MPADAIGPSLFAVAFFGFGSALCWYHNDTHNAIVFLAIAITSVLVLIYRFFQLKRWWLQS